MSRPLRIEYPGAFYHILNRGNAGIPIFMENKDRKKFLYYIDKMAWRFAVKIHTYCLMDTHYHLILETIKANLSQAVGWLNLSYAMYFNTKHKRKGHLFQGRFKSILVQADEYIQELSRYIHLNPVRAHIVDRPQDYEWSSYRAFIGDVKEPQWLETGFLLKLFDPQVGKARQCYKDFVEGNDESILQNPYEKVIAGSVLGSDDFTDWVRENFLSSMIDIEEIPQAKWLKAKPSINVITEKTAEEFGCDEKCIFTKAKKHNIARYIAIYLSKNYGDYPVKKLAWHFGRVSSASISATASKVEKMLKRDEQLRNRMHRILNKCKINF